MSDVKQPAHYLVGGIETIDVIEAKLTREQFHGYLLGSALKYMLRANHKSAFAQDCAKAQQFLDRLYESVGITPSHSDKSDIT